MDWFLELFGEQQAIYNVGQLLANFSTDHEAAGGLTPDNRFFAACQELRKQGKLGGSLCGLLTA